MGKKPNYLIAVSDEELKKHDQYRRIIQPGEALIESPREDGLWCSGLGVLGKDNKWYFHCPEFLLTQAVTYLLRREPSPKGLEIKKSTVENLPGNLQEVLKKLKTNLEDFVEC